MKKLFTKLPIFLLCVSLLAVSCKNDDDGDNNPSGDNPNADAIIYASFTNDGTTQSLTLDESRTTGPIQIENEVIFTQDGTRFNFEFSGVTFIDGTTVFEVTNIISQKFEEDTWSVDSENFMNSTPSKSLDVVLVLDVSSSLGDSLGEIKESAIIVLNQVFTTNSNAKVAVVKFSRGNVATELSTNQSELAQFISTNTSYTDNELGGGTYFLEGQNETALYEAMLTGIDILKDSNARGQGLITFTDGANNFQFNPANDNRNVVVTELFSSDIRSYTVGYVGNANEINEDALRDLAVRGEFSNPGSIDELNNVFTRFSNSVAAIYDLIYNTNNAPFNGEKEFRFLFELNRFD